MTRRGGDRLEFSLTNYKGVFIKIHYIVIGFLCLNLIACDSNKDSGKSLALDMLEENKDSGKSLTLDMEEEKKENILKEVKELLSCETYWEPYWEPYWEEPYGCSYIAANCSCKDLGKFKVSIFTENEYSSKLLAGYICSEMQGYKEIFTKLNDKGEFVSKADISEVDRQKIELKFFESYLSALKQKQIEIDVLNFIYDCKLDTIRSVDPDDLTITFY